MKRFLILIAVFFALVAVVDVCCGFGFDYLKSHAKGGNTYKHYYIAEKCEADVLILGSSRAAHHYVPSIIEDSLDLSCYNAGESGCGIIPAYAYYKMVTERHKPKLVIYEVTPQFDYLVTDEYSKYLGHIRQFYYKKPVRELYAIFGADLDEIRYMSKMYQNNSHLIINIIDWFLSPSKLGYQPLYGVLSEESIERKKSEIRKFPIREVDNDKLKLLEKFIVATKDDGVPLILSISPSYEGTPKDELVWYDEAIRLAEKYGVRFIDANQMEGISHNREAFQDFVHMNDKGATLYTQNLAGLLRTCM